jgi:DNA-binding response OmpR family regulator
MKVLYVSGYTETAVPVDAAGEAPVAFLPKPIDPTALLERIRLLLDAR